MKSVLCVKRIQQVREIAGDPELAYAARTRLHRVIIASTRLVASEVGLPEPLFPGRYEAPKNSPDHLRRVCQVTNHLLDRSRSMGQPSEPLDDRWSEGWSEILGHLDELEHCLSAMESTERPASPRVRLP